MHAIFDEATEAHVVSEHAQIPSTRFATAHLPLRRQLSAWRTALRPLVEMSAAGSPDSGFAARLVAWDLGRLSVVRCQMPSASFARTLRHLTEATPDDWVLITPLDGTISIETRLDRRTISAGGVGIYSLQQELRGSNSATTLLCLIIPRDFCAEAAAVIDPAVNTIVRSSLAGLLVDYVINLEARLPLMPARHLPAIVEATGAMILSSIAQGNEETVPSLQATLFERARSYIRRNLNAPELSVEELCQELGLSRSSLYRLFEAQGGVVQYIRSCRLFDAHRAFEAGQDLRRIHEIAAESGFHDPAAFSRAFKRKFGYSPSEVRSQLHVQG